MGRSTGPKLRKVRAHGEDFAMAADRSLANKYVKSHRKQPPGMHGNNQRFRKHSNYSLQLREKQKAKILYHLTEKQMRRYYQMAADKAGSTSDTLLKILESRLDNIVYRAGFANSHPAARQLVSHRQFSWNGQRVSIPSILVAPGDKITFVGKSGKLKEGLTNTATENNSASWLDVDPKAATILVKNLPEKEEAAMPLNEQLIVEFYSR
ncbi:30S ribosomal protein S4 [Patescibacteria group bacterium]|nr:30S ribosomal protein S4 [Patescibacteria group bacterium]